MRSTGELIFIHVIQGLCTYFWLWFIIWENEQRRLEAQRESE